MIPSVTAVTPDDTSQADDVQKAQRDPAAFAALYRRYLTPIYRYVYSRVGNRNDAEDLTSQVFTILFGVQNTVAKYWSIKWNIGSRNCCTKRLNKSGWLLRHWQSCPIMYICL
jgi:hypothetical protein